MKKFGIFLAYPPTTELRGEGLGRHLAYLLKGAARRDGARFVVACPSWTVESLRKLCEAEHVPPESFELLAVPNLPISLRLHALSKSVLTFIAAKRARARRRRRWRVMESLRTPFERFLVSTRSLLAFAAIVLLAIPLIVVGAVAWTVVKAARAIARRSLGRMSGMSRFEAFDRMMRVVSSIREPGTHPMGRALYRTLETAEADLLLARIHGRDDIAAWYCPTAFWPQFNAIERPRLVCVPDVVLSRLPVSFALTTGRLGAEVFARMKKTIEGAPHLVTYSDDVKWVTLVRDFGCEPERVHVIRHGNNDLGPYIRLTGTPDDEAATRDFCRTLLANALARSTQPAYIQHFANREFRFIFCPNQVRPNKNIVTLLLAYEHLLRERGLPHKLVMTGDAEALEQARGLIAERRLANDVLCLRGLSVQQLAACYALSDVAVNPSLFEGGCPFTLSEALSVGTPTVLARIAVTEEVIHDPVLRASMLFDPYDWVDMADRVEWAIANREELLGLQRERCADVLARSWSDVADDYLALLDAISNGAAPERGSERPQALATEEQPVEVTAS